MLGLWGAVLYAMGEVYPIRALALHYNSVIVFFNSTKLTNYLYIFLIKIWKLCVLKSIQYLDWMFVTFFLIKMQSH